MYYETVKTPSKCSHNLWIIKVNKKPEITLPAVHCIYVIKLQLESLLSTYHIFSYFDFHSLLPVKKYKSNRSFLCKAPRLAFSFLPPARFEIFTAGFSSRVFIFLSFTDWGNPTILVYSQYRSVFSWCENKQKKMASLL